MGTDTGAVHRILVVDDEPDITALVAYHLAKEGYRVTTAGTGSDALRSASEERPDLVVLDLMLPGHSGFEVLAELRRRDETRDVGVLLLTARKDEPDRIKGLSLGADDYLAKPFSPKELVLRVGAILPRRATRCRGRPHRRWADRGRPRGPSRHGRRQGSRADRDRIQAARAPDRAPRSRAIARAAARIRLAGAARHPDA